MDKELNEYGDNACDDFSYIDEDAEIEYIIEQNRNEYKQEWNDYQEECELFEDD
jgi:hypothetical protein